MHKLNSGIEFMKRYKSRFKIYHFGNPETEFKDSHLKNTVLRKTSYFTLLQPL